MIQVFVDKFMAATPTIKHQLGLAYPNSYEDLVRRAVACLSNVTSEQAYGDGVWPDSDRVTVIDHGDWQGTKVFVIGAGGHQPSTYWSIFVHYGSCSVCDTFQRIRESYDTEVPTPEQVTQYWTLMLHMVQSMRLMGETHES